MPMPALPGRSSWLWQLGSVGLKMVDFQLIANDSRIKANERINEGIKMGHEMIFKCWKRPLEGPQHPPALPKKAVVCVGGGYGTIYLKKRPVVPQCALSWVFFCMRGF